jgi:hypothetical protein
MVAVFGAILKSQPKKLSQMLHVQNRANSRPGLGGAFQNSGVSIFRPLGDSESTWRKLDKVGSLGPLSKGENLVDRRYRSSDGGW